MDAPRKENKFSGSIGFVLAAAGSAVGLGNIWRFPYLAAKDGGGLFLLTYIVLALTFGFALLTSEIAIGRKTGLSPWTAYGALDKRFKWVGPIACLIPMLILPYYCAIGGWILKYLASYVTGQGAAMAADGYFSAFTQSLGSPIIWFLIYFAATVFVVFKGVNDGIEKLSKILMPILILMVLGISIFSLTLTHTDDAGVTRTGLQGFMVYVIPSFEGLTLAKFATVLMDAMGQLFYSVSVAMGIMVAYGSYVKKETNLVKSVNQIEFFDTLIAFLAGMMIIPAVYTFMGTDGMASGPSLMFVALPKIFMAMGGMGTVVAIVFFIAVAFAALTSSVSIMEAIVACCIDRFGMSRKKATLAVSGLTLVLGTAVCLGYNVLFFNITLPNGSPAQILDVMDYASNYVLMPMVAIAECLLIGWTVKPQTTIEEVTINGEKFARAKLYTVMVKYITPVMLFFLLLQSFGLIK